MLGLGPRLEYGFGYGYGYGLGCEGVHDEEVVEVEVARIRGRLVLPAHLQRQRARTARDEQWQLGENKLARRDVPPKCITRRTVRMARPRLVRVRRTYSLRYIQDAGG